MQPQQRNFQSDFWRRLNYPQARGDTAARDVMDKIGRVFPGKKHQLVVSLLEWITNPRTQKLLKKHGAEINAKLLQSLFPRPPRKELVNLKRRLETIGKSRSDLWNGSAGLVERQSFLEARRRLPFPGKRFEIPSYGPRHGNPIKGTADSQSVLEAFTPGETLPGTSSAADHLFPAGRKAPTLCL